jgi:branched-chain amino acid aminotransferase
VPPQTVLPTIKHYHWLDFEMGLFEAFDAGAETVVLSDQHGNVTEGPGFNIFMVREGQVRTPADGVLDGMTRETVLELCAEIQVPAFRDVVTADALRCADEVFLTSTAGGIIPVAMIDTRPVADGRPGVLTKKLSEIYLSKRKSGWYGTPIPGVSNHEEALSGTAR